ncbi:MAG: ABC transporter ATP-binding protein [Clostridiales bacterium]|nr:ABC transporter ATP-binding protein [Clostridiales bacterium]HBM79391.1 ABC transporter ATP-binding protein [Clostridiaceae bacterium]
MLEIKNLCKRYGKFNALDNLSLSIDEGEIFGFVGPNGAGKTTAMKIVCGLLSPTSGKVYIDDSDIIEDVRKAKSKIGYMPDFFGVYDNLKVDEYLQFYASIYGIKKAESKKITNELLDLVGLSDKSQEYVDSLSRGMKQRLCFARCLVHNPRLLVLDEPASGMDPKSRIEMKDILRTLKDMGKTILVSSHILSDLAKLCTTIGIIDHGRIVAQGSVDEINARVHGRRTIRIKLKRKTDEALRLLREFITIDKVSIEREYIEAGFTGDDNELRAILERLITCKIPVITFTQTEGNLEDIFMKVIGGANTR